MSTANQQNKKSEHNHAAEVSRLKTMKTYLAGLMNKADSAKLMHCSPAIIEPIFNGATMMNPASLFLNTGSAEDMDYIRQQALNHNEEFALANSRHTCHFDGPKDQGRDTVNTKYLASTDTPISSLQQKLEHRDGLVEVRTIMNNLMVNKEMIVSFISRGPIGSRVADPTLQITDSYYVIHSEYLLYRMLDPETFSRDVEEKGYLFINYHTAGELTPEHVSAHLEHRRIYMDVERFHSYSVNNQYAGNSIAPKKINHRFANMNNLRCHFGKRLDEHMFITGFEVDNETVYFAGAYPSGCGKTGTAMTGDTLIGDDLAKIFIDEESGEVRAVNPEKGMFGIIEGVNRQDDPETLDVLEREGEEVIFSNLLVHEQKPFWQGCDYELPKTGRNFAGAWSKDSGQPMSHKNARFTISLDTLANYSSATEKPEGVKLSALVFGGRDYTTMPTVIMAHDWMNTVVHGAIIRSATTATELGADGSEKRSPFANEAFFPGPLGQYISHYKAFGENPAIAEDYLPSGFQVNYWLHKNARYKLALGEEDGLLGEKQDTKVWMRIMALMHQGKVETIWTPIGLIPKYRNLEQLFSELLAKEYSQELYNHQFSLYIENLIRRIDLSLQEFAKEQGMPEEFFHTLDTWKRDLQALEFRLGPVVTPAQMIAYVDTP
ncbi:phosphoenolpyruvate carboxykinase (GTP) [Desulfobulbus sp. TB]|nr:phosphoenolpyruvate carboxykinase (GTP) [Desulfobulbus sp. TB]